MMQVENLCTRTDALRERELYRYFEPPEVETHAAREGLAEDGSSSSGNAKASLPPSTTLTALAQLCALRLDAKRAVVSVIGRKTQYFLAEATRFTDITNHGAREVGNEDMWLGLGTIDKTGGLCENTLALPTSPGTYPCFTVPDLTQDERFSQLSIVTGAPHFRFYAGTPLTTSNGVNIGSFFIFDDKFRSGLTPNEETYFGSVAATIMANLELAREAEERDKVLRMSRGLNAFVEGKDSVMTATRGAEDDPSSPVAHEIDTTHTSIEGSHKATFSRAANLLADSLNLETRGGVCFLDTLTGPRSLALGTNGTRSFETESDSEPRESAAKAVAEKQRNTQTRNDTKAAAVISFSGSSPTPLDTPEKRPGTFSALEERFLQSLLKHYPRGKVWIFDAAEGLITSEEDDHLSGSGASEEQRERRLQRKKLERETLRRYFPHAFELIFFPLYDASLSRFSSASFAWRTTINRKHSIEAELQFVKAFGNSVMAEIQRLASIYESRQKGDFIGSISHELRSPLHGILASAEFLSETRFDAFQSSLVDTISSCGRTLLDTIEHILDFSKINSFERNWRDARKLKSGRRALRNEAAKPAVAKDAPPLMSIYAVTDVAAIVEEVVEGVYAGQVYKDYGSADITDVSAGQRGKTSDRGLSIASKSPLGGSFERHNFKSIEVILDIAKDDYCFTTQPGALRRKYTLAGKIEVKLRLEPPDRSVDERNNHRVLNITITDTGRGISSDYLRTSLYTPFSQENVLANGTGLGLSIVRSIVSMLEGTIEVQSQVGQGTEVQVRIPLKREMDADTPISTPNSIGSPDSLQDNSISILQTNYPMTKVSIYDAGVSDSTKEAATQTSAMALYYVKEWFELEIEPIPLERSADVIIVEERDLRELLVRLQPGPAIVVLCSKTYRLQAAEFLHRGAIEFMSTPFGPYKLAKAIRLSLESSLEIVAGLTPQPRPMDDSSQMSESNSNLPEFGSLTLVTENEETPIMAQSNGVVTASHSSNARMALGSGSSGQSNESREDFPFPAQSMDSPRSNSSAHGLGEIMQQTPRRPQLSSRKTEPVFRPSFPHTSTLTSQGALATSDVRDRPKQTGNLGSTTNVTAIRSTIEEVPEEVAPSGSEREKRAPRLLLVDDNKINLRLLATFMKKRKHEFVDSAEDGALAVEAARRHSEGYDIIFMVSRYAWQKRGQGPNATSQDLSMPVMNGFEATRAIRELEQKRDASVKSSKPKAMIIALTGLASGRDHGEAFACGVDLYMTKPVSFKEVGRLLDNWEAHGGLKNPKPALEESGKEGMRIEG
ncbi:MAG: hypothetical protein Q9212_005272 [Teloschistes hypoglaucus]